MSEIKKRSLSLQNNVIFSADWYSRSECSPEKLKRKSQRQQQTIILTTPMKIVEKSNPNIFEIYIDGNQTVKEGWLYQSKKTYVELTRQSIREYNDEQKTSLIKVISLKEFEFNIQQDKQIIKIQFPHLHQIVIYQAKDAVEAKMWVGCFNIVLDKHRNHPKNKLSLLEISKYFGINVISEDYFLKIVESGDLLLFETNNTGAKLQRVFTNTKYDHVAIAIKMANKYLFIFDANADTGVTFMEWSQFIEINDLYEKLAIRKLIGVDRRQLEIKLIEFLQQVHGKKYEVTFSKLFRYCNILLSQLLYNQIIKHFDNKRVQVLLNQMKVSFVQNQWLKHLNIVDYQNQIKQAVHSYLQNLLNNLNQLIKHRLQMTLL